jgi:hypothetical protein
MWDMLLTQFGRTVFPTSKGEIFYFLLQFENKKKTWKNRFIFSPITLIS